ncbi:hypothetical protein FFF93_009955 [Arthrobacter sp. KBS0702]|uniref:hypothetical protein n=1 Tax=Arthrobacter sp. KBS0702 TaxID=2578107 RepID=UPI00110E14C9|nr:hypothetical protein [Arthrobacter sp. KBS0702]QDW30051.1 hypothetical protein FFF93_009955 [Arthrobacter sp. KBS0702]
MELDLADWGVPPEAQILSLTFTPQAEPGGGVLVPAALQQHLTKGPIAHVQRFVAWPLSGNPQTCEVTVGCVWLDSQAEVGMEPLVAAIESFSNKEYRAAVIPAMVAVEVKLNSVLAEHYSAFRAKKHAVDFLNDTPLAFQLDYLLPSLMNLVGAPPLGSEVTRQLKTLKGFRNDVAHTHRPMSGAATADALLSAIFGYRYLSLYGGRLSAGN